jgi:hypothetical protein
MRPMRLTAAVACLVAAAGCGSERPPGARGPSDSVGTAVPGRPPASTPPSAPGSGSPDEPVTSSPRPPGGPGGRSPGVPTPIKPRGGTERPRPVKFESARPTAGGRTLEVTWWSGVEPCHVLDRVTVDYRGGSVEVTLYEGQDPTKKNRACIEIAVQKRTLVPLRTSLGDRKIVDGAE